MFIIRTKSQGFLELTEGYIFEIAYIFTFYQKTLVARPFFFYQITPLNLTNNLKENKNNTRKYLITTPLRTVSNIDFPILIPDYMKTYMVY